MIRVRDDGDERIAAADGCSARGRTHARLKSGRSSGNVGWGAALSPSNALIKKELGRSALRGAAKVPITRGGM